MKSIVRGAALPPLPGVLIPRRRSFAWNSDTLGGEIRRDFAEAQHRPGVPVGESEPRIVLEPRPHFSASEILRLPNARRRIVRAGA